MPESLEPGVEGGESGTSAETICLYLLFVIFLLIVGTLAGYMLRKCKSRYFQEASMMTLIGVLGGLLLKLCGHDADLSLMETGFPNIFFLVLLAPIIFESAYNTNKKVFYSNLGSILVYAFLGTSIAAIVTTLLIYSLGYYGLAPEFTLYEAAAYGCLISATDPVSVIAVFKEIHADKTLFSMIFGESIFNDAVTIVMYQTIVQAMRSTGASPVTNLVMSCASFLLVFIGSFAIGAAVSFGTAYILKTFHPVIHDPVGKNYNRAEIAIMVASPFCAYLIAQGLELSGIVSILFCGLILSQYAAELLSIKSRKVLKLLYQSGAYVCESSVFLFLGMSAVEYYVVYVKAGTFLLVGNIVIVLVARYYNIGICSLICNTSRVRKPIGGIFQFVVWYSGLRGTIAYILALQCANDFKEGNGDVIVLITIIFALFTLFVQSSLLNPLMDFCDVKDKPEPVLEGKPQLEETGCCQDLKSAFAYMDKFVFKNYFHIPKDELKDTHSNNYDSSLKEHELEIRAGEPMISGKAEGQ